MTVAQSLAFVFPGQGSQSVGMLKALADTYPQIQQTFEQASDALGLDLWALAQQGPPELLDQTHNTQPALLCAGIAIWRLWEQLGGPRPAYVAGHSLGEYTALVAAGVLDFDDGLRLVAERGRLMQQAVAPGQGAMAAIVGLNDPQVDEACRQAAQGQVVVPANLNAPGQVVIAGQREAVERAGEAARALGARKVVVLAVSAPSHCELMRPAAQQLAAQLEAVQMSSPAIAVVHNVSAAPISEVEAIRQALIRQLHQPVRWVESVRWLIANGVSHMAECGPGKVLCGLARRIERGLDVQALEQPQALTQALSIWANGGGERT